MEANEYYRYQYPYDELVALLTCNGDDLSCLEFAFEGEVYKRYVSVTSPNELKVAAYNFPGIRTIHFGAFYGRRPSRNMRDNAPRRRVLSFDIDLTDKEWLPVKDATGEVSAELCDKAWCVSAASIDILKRLLKVAFGYTKVLAVYSGRRGVHVHVFDDAAMSLSSEGRSAVVGYINGNVNVETERATSGVRLVMQMHNLKKLVYVWFNEMMTAGLFDSVSARRDLVRRLDLAKYNQLKDELGTLEDDAGDMEDGPTAWRYILDKLNAAKKKVPWVSARLDCAVLAYVWPKLDEKVTGDIAHLTKVPFACHAKSGRVACAVDPNGYWDFCPRTDAPSLRDDDWNEVAMVEALRHFHPHGDDVPPDPMEEDEEEEKMAAEAVVALMDMEDLAGAQARPQSPRKLTWKRKQSPLVPS